MLKDVRLKESAWNFDILYTCSQVEQKIRYLSYIFTKYDNHTDIPSYGGGYGNFQDEKDIKFMVMMPFTVF